LRAENQKLKTDLSLQLENVQSEIRALSISVDEYKELLKRPSRDKEEMEGRLKILEERRKTQEDRTKEIEDRLKGLDGKTAGSISKPMESERLASTKEIPAELKGVSTGMGDLYKDAYETFHKGDLDGARRKFEAFLKQYPNTELSDNAQFWIGETYYLKKDFERAILEYEKAIVKYPEGDKIPAALFKQALAFLELGDKANARNLLKRVIEKYPHSDQVELAKKKLETIK
jgi:tol-pal system protein YbgF